MIESLTFIEFVAFIIAVLISLVVGVKLRQNAKAHEQAAQNLDKKIAQAINWRSA